MHKYIKIKFQFTQFENNNELLILKFYLVLFFEIQSKRCKFRILNLIFTDIRRNNFVEHKIKETHIVNFAFHLKLRKLYL